MALIFGTVGLLVASSSGLLCAPLALNDTDEEEVLEFAQQYIHEIGFDAGTAEISNEKCGYEIPEIPPKRFERITLVALFAEQSDRSGESSRKRVDCYVRRFFEDGMLRELKKICDVTTQHLLSFRDISAPVQLYGEMSFEEARTVLRSLSEKIGEWIHGQRFGEQEFSNIFYLQAHPSHSGSTNYTVISGDDSEPRFTIRLRGDGTGGFVFQ